VLIQNSFQFNYWVKKNEIQLIWTELKAFCAIAHTCSVKFSCTYFHAGMVWAFSISSHNVFTCQILPHSSFHIFLSLQANLMQWMDTFRVSGTKMENSWMLGTYLSSCFSPQFIRNCVFLFNLATRPVKILFKKKTSNDCFYCLNTTLGLSILVINSSSISSLWALLIKLCMPSPFYKMFTLAGLHGSCMQIKCQSKQDWRNKDGGLMTRYAPVAREKRPKSLLVDIHFLGRFSL